MDIRENQLYIGGVSAESLAEAYGTPLYVYEESIIRRQCRLLRESFINSDIDFHYAMKANNNPALLTILRDEGVHIDAVSPHEVRLALETGFGREQILFTGNNSRDEDFAFCQENKVLVNAGSLSELERLGRMNPGGRVSIRVNPDVGAGHHPHVITGGPDSKFGIYHTETDAVHTLLREHNLTLAGITSHIGTGILKTEDMLQAMEVILNTADKFADIEFVDFGGGFGIPYQPNQAPLPIADLGRAMAERFAAFCTARGKALKMKLEPGRYLVAQSASLLVRITNIQMTPAHTFVGTDSGFNHLLRPILYGSHHEILNASAMEGEQLNVVVAGNICESGDVFTRNGKGLEDRPLTRPEVGDLLALRDVGAYGMSLASQYNLRARPAEILVDEGSARLIRLRETYEDLVRPFVILPNLAE